MSELSGLESLSLAELAVKEIEVYTYYQKILELKQLSEKDLLQQQITELEAEKALLDNQKIHFDTLITNLLAKLALLE